MEKHNHSAGGLTPEAGRRTKQHQDVWPLNSRQEDHARTSGWIIGLFVGALAGWAKHAAAQPITTFAANAQHISQYAPAAQHLGQVRWSTSINLTNTGAYGHYGAPLITTANTVITPVRIASGFQVSAFDGATGRLKYTLTNDYILPTYNWFPAYQPVIATSGGDARLYYPGAGGTVYYVDNIDSDAPGVPVQQCFYTDLASYQTNAQGTNGFNNTVFMDTPITADTNGDIFFGFRVQGTAPVPLNTTQSGYARIDPNGNARYVLAEAACGDSRIGRDCHNCAPALSNDGATLYVVVKDINDALFGYLLGLDSTTLATKYQTTARDPASSEGADILDDSTASPMVGPDGDVFFGINAGNDRGVLLHFSGDLKTQMPSGGFGWDYTAGVVPTNMVPGYMGSSSYLLMAKYNNYAGSGGGDGINRIALLDPHATQIDPHRADSGFVEMREVLSVIGATPDSAYQNAAFPYAVREWCVNTAAVNPSTSSVLAPSEDGHIYRWNLAENSLSEVLALGGGLGEPYVPTVIGPDGTVYTLTGGKLFALGGLTNVAVTLASSVPNMLNVVAGQAVTFTAIVTNLDSSGPVPTGTVTFQDLTYRGLTPVTTTLAAAVPLTNGMASVTTSSLLATSNYLGSHFIAANYSGDATFPAGTATRVQKIHAWATVTTLNASETAPGGQVTVTASVASAPAGGGVPTGMVSFWVGSNVLAQIPLRTNGEAYIILPGLSGGSAAITANYSSDTLFASSSGSLGATPPYITDPKLSPSGFFQFSFTNTPGMAFRVWSESSLDPALNNWTLRGPTAETSPGQFLFIDSQAPSNTQQFYRVSSP